jgi:hypothetical protein
MRRWKHRPEGSNWGDFGDDDQIGRLNLLTAEIRRAALLEARTGLAFVLSLPLDVPGGEGLADVRHAPRRGHDVLGTNGIYNLTLEDSAPGAQDVCCDDSVLLYTQYSTQWDALSHCGALFDADGDGVPEKVYYNGYRAEEHISKEKGAAALGMEQAAVMPLQTAGVMLDLHSVYGDAHMPVGYDKLMRLMEQQNVEVRFGDILCLHTGYATILLGMNRRPNRAKLAASSPGLDGRDERLLRWITDSGIVAIAADNMAVEYEDWEEMVRRCGTGQSQFLWPLHHHCLFKLGILLGELWYMHDLALWLRTNQRSRFLLTAAPLRLPGATGSPVTPIATV